MGDEDPFSVFSDDESENDEGVEQEVFTTETAKALVERANAKLQALPEKALGEIEEDEEVECEDVEGMMLDESQKLELDWPLPLYLGPCHLTSSLEVGGGRGYVAARTLDAGTLILLEEPAMKWPDEQIGQELGLISVRHLFDNPKLVKDMELLHPTKEDVDNHAYDEDKKDQIGRMLDALQSDGNQSQKAEAENLALLAKEMGVTSRDGSALKTRDIFRLFLALRYNGLETGVYRHVAMLNHNCHPNCAKLLPQGGKTYSEVRTTRRVLAGESLTISYVPRIMSHASRRKYLWEQHRFDIGVQMKKEFTKMELVGNGLPKSHVQKWEDESITHRVETTVAELDEIREQVNDDIESGTTDNRTWETLKALEQSSLELFKESVQQLKNPEHILLAAMLMIHVEVCEQLRKATNISLPSQLSIVARQISSLYCLIPLQCTNLGKDHFDLARSNLDLANGIDELLSRSPRLLYDLRLQRLQTFKEWSELASISRKEHKRIKELYPQDAETFALRSPREFS